MTWPNGLCISVFMNHNQLITPKKKLQKNHRSSISILDHVKKILHNFQWNPPSKTRKRDDWTLKTSSCEISFWVLRHVSVAIVTYFNETAHTMKQETYVSWNIFHETYCVPWENVAQLQTMLSCFLSIQMERLQQTVWNIFP